MKKKILLTLLYFLTMATYIIAQTPGFNYQAVLRNPAGETMTSEAVTLHFSLLDTDESVIYKESQVLNTDELGILTCMIGTGNVEFGTFSDIIGKQDVTLKIEAELPGTTGMTSLGESKLGIIPYALYGKDEDSDPDNEMQSISISGDSLHLTGSTSVSLENFKNYWEYTQDSNAFLLRFSDSSTQRDDEDQGIEFRYINGTVIKTNRFDQNEFAVFTLNNKEKVEDLPLELRKSLNKLTAFLHEQFDIDFETIELNINAEFKARNNNIRDFELEATLGDVNKTQIYIETRLLFPFGPSIELTYTSGDKNIFIRGVFNEDCSVFTPLFGSEEVLGVVDFFSYFGGKKMSISPEIVNQSFSSGNPAVQVEKDQETGGTKWSMFSDTENNDCYHVNTTLDGVYSILYGNSPDIIAQLFADDDAGLNLSGNGCGAQANCKNFLLVNDNGKRRSAPFISSQLTSNTDLSGVLQLNGDQSANLQMTSLAGFPNNGYLLVLDNQSQNKAGIYVNEANEGVVYASNISAVVQENGSNSTVYGALVGDESAAYTRGTDVLINGEATVICPDHFQDIADPNSMTVTITPLSAESKGVAVVEKFAGGFKVKELASGSGNYQFDYMVSCKRKSQREFVVKKTLPRVSNTALTPVSKIFKKDALLADKLDNSKKH